ncbi:MAG TPA: hypothetical protein VKI00_24785 [Mycobacterium sp.]|uniref:hypothetical protein n=1 Tax=Mycobacterium sp. TaxID=1785 RepID=UPI002D19C3F5|nr:hypothetical protein [Mycobacterium sp.]HME78750.1 hypothetical protein [Mycobacterium sp.]
MNAAEFAPFIPAGQMPRSRIFRQSYLTVWFYVGQIDRVEVEGAFNSLSGFTEGITEKLDIAPQLSMPSSGTEPRWQIPYLLAKLRRFVTREESSVSKRKVVSTNDIH